METEDQELVIFGEPHVSFVLLLFLLGIAFSLLKLANATAVASWPWWLVLLPFYVFRAVKSLASSVMDIGAIIVVLIGGPLFGLAIVVERAVRWYRRR